MDFLIKLRQVNNTAIQTDGLNATLKLNDLTNILTFDLILFETKMLEDKIKALK